MRIKSLCFSAEKCGRPVTVGNASKRSARPSYGELSWAEADSVAAMVRHEIMPSARLGYLDGGEVANFYLMSFGMSRRVLVAGKDWVLPGGEDKILAAHQAFVGLAEVMPRQITMAGDCYRLENPDGTMLSVFETGYFDKDKVGAFCLCAAMGGENYVHGRSPITYSYTPEIVEAFLDQLFYNYSQLDGRLPRFDLWGDDVWGRRGQRGETCTFVFLWCEGFERVSRERLAEHLVAQVAPPALFDQPSLRGRRQEFIELIERRVAQMAG